MKRIRGHLTYANVIATLALFVALGAGSAYATQQLAEKSVGARQLRHGAVTADKLRKNAVTAPKIEALAVKNGKLANAAVTQAKLGKGAVGVDQLAAGAVTAEKIANGAVGGDKVDEATLGQVPSAARAGVAASADSANPGAFAKVGPEGQVDPSLSKGIGSGDVSLGAEPGIYCISAPGFNARGAQATPQFAGSGSLTAFVAVGGTGSCAAPLVEVQLRNPALVKGSFFVVLYR